MDSPGILTADQKTEIKQKTGALPGPPEGLQEAHKLAKAEPWQEAAAASLKDWMTPSTGLWPIHHTRNIVGCGIWPQFVWFSPGAPRSHRDGAPTERLQMPNY